MEAWLSVGIVPFFYLFEKYAISSFLSSLNNNNIEGFDENKKSCLMLWARFFVNIGNFSKPNAYL